jgi:hypothetical protein
MHQHHHRWIFDHKLCGLQDDPADRVTRLDQWRQVYRKCSGRAQNRNIQVHRDGVQERQQRRRREIHDPGKQTAHRTVHLSVQGGNIEGDIYQIEVSDVTKGAFY